MKKRCLVVMDTNVFVSALRSKRGSSFRMLSLVGTGLFDIALSVPLVLEYEQAARGSRWRHQPAWPYVSDLIDYLCRVARKPEIHYLWRPREKDPKDDMVLEVAVAGRCDCIVTYNKKDFLEAESFGLELLTPKEFLTRIGELK